MNSIMRKKLCGQRRELMSLLTSILQHRLNDHDDNTLAAELVDLFIDALHSRQPNEYAEKMSELIVRNHWFRPHQLGDLLRVLSIFPLRVLSQPDMIDLQPRLVQVIADISNAYWRHVFNAVQLSEEKVANKIPPQTAKKEAVPVQQQPFIPSLIRDFLETNQTLQNEIAEHRKARTALVESERRYRTLAESAHDYIFIINKDDQVEYVNKYAAELFASLQQDIAGRSRSLLFDSDSNRGQKEDLKQLFQTSQTLYRQNWTTLRDGTRIYLDTHLVPLKENGQIRAVLGIARNMTREKKSEEKIAESEKKYHSLFDAIHNPIFLIDDGRIVDCNKSSTFIFEQSKAELIGRPFCHLIVPHHSDIKRLRAINRSLEECLRGSEQHFEIDYRRDEKTLYFEIHFSNFGDSEPPLVLAVVRNVTPYKKANEAIRASEERFRDIIRRSIDGYFFIDVKYRVVHLNNSAEAILTYSRDELNEQLFSKLHQEWNKKVHRLLKNAMGGQAFEWEEFYFKDKRKKDRWVAINLRRVYEDGIVTGVEGFIKDITHRKTAQIELIENEARYRALFESTPFDVFGLTLEQYFSKVNQNFQHNWGHVDGRALKNFRPRALATLIEDLCDKVANEQKTHEAKFSRTREHFTRYFRVILAPIITENEEMIGFAGLIIDNTDAVISLAEKKTFAERLIQSSEEEQRRISRDIHDSLGQMLFALQLDLSAAKSALKKDAKLAEHVLQKSEQKLSTCMKEASAICYRLSPQILADFGLVEALEDLVHHIEMSGNIIVEFEKKWRRRNKSKNLETALFRVSQEALANILKHANASQVRIMLFEFKDRIELSISDNGVGFDLEAMAHNRRRGFGLINMKERIELLGGHFMIVTQPKSGTRIDIILPLQLKDTHEQVKSSIS